MAGISVEEARSSAAIAETDHPLCPIGGAGCRPIYWRNTALGSRSLRIYRCDDCRHAFVANRSHDELDAFYDGEYGLRWQRETVGQFRHGLGGGEERLHRAREGSTLGRWELIGSYFGPGHRVLDVGCGAGTFMRHAAPHVAEIHGLDLNGAFVDYINDRGFGRAHRIALEDFVSDVRYDVVVSWHCMEHTVDVALFIERAAAFLNEGGLLFLEVPTINDWRNPPRGGFYKDSHLHYFSPKSLCTLISRQFSIFKTWTGLEPPATMLAARKRA
jgi:2-polyprenyl-3-methyl-5-hydroxy-6-metoxy-1,4-benzoquinol methylase